jgi:hypothetical protein
MAPEISHGCSTTPPMNRFRHVNSAQVIIRIRIINLLCSSNYYCHDVDGIIREKSKIRKLKRKLKMLPISISD